MMLSRKGEGDREIIKVIKNVPEKNKFSSSSSSSAAAVMIATATAIA